MAETLQSYRAVAAAYSAGARALFTGPQPGAEGVERGAGASFGVLGASEDLERQGSQLAPVSEEFTAAAAALLADPDPQVRADASAQMLAKALVDLEISAYFLQAADFAENPGEQSFGLERSVSFSAAAETVDEALAVILAEPGKGGDYYRGHNERGEIILAFGVSAPTHVPAARKQLSQAALDLLKEIESRAGKTAQSALGGLFAMGIGQVTQAAGLVGLNIAQAVGIGEKASQLYNLVRTFFLNAYNTIATMLGPVITKTATTQVVSWVHGAVQGKQFIQAVNTIYGTASTQAELKKLVEESQAGLDQYAAALKALEGLNGQYLKQVGIVEKVIQVLKFVPSIPLSAVPQARLLLGATYIVLTGYVIFAGADYVDAPRFSKLDRIPGPRKIIRKHLYPDADASEGGGKDMAEPPSGEGKRPRPPAPPPPAPSVPPAEQPPKMEEPVETAPPEEAAAEPPAPADEIPEEVYYMEDEEDLAEIPTSGAEPPEEEVHTGARPRPPAPPPPGGIDFGIPGAGAEPDPPGDGLISEQIRLDVAAPQGAVTVDEPFEIAVAVRRPESSKLKVDGLDKVTSADGEIFRSAQSPVVVYKVKVSAPTCAVETAEHIFRLRPGRDTEAYFFILTPKTEGLHPIVVTAYQVDREEEWVVAQTRVRVDVKIRAVAPAAPSRSELIETLASQGVPLPMGSVPQAGRFIYENLDVELFDYTVDDMENERFKVRVECALAGEQSIRDADEVIVSPGLRRDLARLKRRGLDSAEMAALGKEIGGMLFPPKARRYFEQSFARLREEDEALRIRIKTAEYPLASIAWEYAYITPSDAPEDYAGDDGYLALNRRISIVRYEVQGRPVTELEPVDGAQLVMLLMLANTADPQYPQLDLRKEKKVITAALEKNSQIELRSYGSATFRDVQDALDTRAHIFHFAGHGTFKGELGPLRTLVGEGYLLLKGKTEAESLFSATKLALNLRDSGVRLAVLGACQAGERDPLNPWTGIAPALARAGIPAVVAMQFTVYDHAAIAFHRSFYRSLAAGEAVDTAVSDGRRAVYNLPDAGRDWGTPVLYLRAEDGVLFPRPPAPPLEKIAFTPPVASSAAGQNGRALKLYEVLAGFAFSLDDLEELCFKLGVDWDYLEHDTKPEAARSLIQHFTKHGDLDRLYTQIKADRPNLGIA